jgi:hypothetical protein
MGQAHVILLKNPRKEIYWETRWRWEDIKNFLEGSCVWKPGSDWTGSVQYPVMNFCVYVDEPLKFTDFNESLKNSELLKRQYAVDLIWWFCTRDLGYLVLCWNSRNGQVNMAVFTSTTQSTKTQNQKWSRICLDTIRLQPCRASVFDVKRISEQNAL